MTEKLISILKLVRPINFVITFISAVVAVFICDTHNFSLKIAILAGLSAAITLSAGNIINDVYDFESDKINHPKRPLASGILARSSAIVFYVLLIILSTLLSYLLNFNALLIVIVANLLLFFYSKLFKKIPLIGNLVVALLTGLVFIYGGVAVDNPYAAIIPALFAFLINLIREIVKDMQDVQGDENAGMISFPIKYGFKKSRTMILVVCVLLLLFTFYPFIMQLYKIEYFVIVMIVVNPLLVYSLKILFNNDSQEGLSKVSNLLKFDMVFGLIAIYFGV